jgi:hypothetical protein
LASAALGACADDASLIGVRSYSVSYVPGEARVGYGAVQVVTRGTPFIGFSPALSDVAVLAALQNQGFYQTNYVAEKVPGSPYRVAVVFNPPTNLDPSRICAIGPDLLPPTLGGPPTGPRMPVVMALCRADQFMSGADGTIAAPSGLHDPAFQAAMGDYMMALVPAVNPERTPASDYSSP